MARMISPEQAKQYLAANLRRLMEERNVGHQELADKANCSRMMVWYLVAGKRQASASILANIAEYFDITTDELLACPNGAGRKAHKIA